MNYADIAQRAAVMALLALALVAGPAFAAAGDDEPRPMASFNFTESPATEVLSALSEFYGVQFRASAPMPQPITLNSQGQVDLDGAAALLAAEVADQGLAVRREDGAVKVVARSGLLAMDIQVVRLKHADPKAVAKVVVDLFHTRDVWMELAVKDPKYAEHLMPHLGKGGVNASESLRVEATPWPPLKAVIVKAPKQVMPLIREFITNEIDAAEGKVLQAKAEAKRRADAARAKAEAERRKRQKTPLPEQTRTFQPMFVEAKYIADFCQRLKGFRPQTLPHNVLMHKTRKYAEFKALEEVLAMLDVPDTTALQQYYIQLNHATASKVRDLLLELYRFTLDNPVTEAGADQLAAEDGPAAEPSATDDALAEMGLESDQVDIPVGEVTIVADHENNALIVRTIPANIDAIRDLVAKIDRPRGQVLIEVFIANIGLSDTTELGIDFLQGDQIDQVNNVGVSNGKWSIGQGFGVADSFGGATFSLNSGNLDLIIRALQSTSHLDIVSRPSVTTLDNSPAIFEFGKQVPLIQASNVNVSGEVISSTVEYQPVDTRLVVTPHINAGGFVTLKIEQRIDDLSDERFIISEQLEPQLLIKRHVETNVRVYDGQTVFLGGFIDDKKDKTESKVPILGDIPILGHLFRSTIDTYEKTELLIFITPHVVRTPQELLNATNRKRIQAKSHADDTLGRPELEVDASAAPNTPISLPALPPAVEPAKP